MWHTNEAKYTLRGEIDTAKFIGKSCTQGKML